jgi:hypothetical protein
MPLDTRLRYGLTSTAIEIVVMFFFVQVTRGKS